jgi:hypothetical protein
MHNLQGLFAVVTDFVVREELLELIHMRGSTVGEDILGEIENL